MKLNNVLNMFWAKQFFIGGFSGLKQGFFIVCLSLSGCNGEGVAAPKGSSGSELLLSTFLANNRVDYAKSVAIDVDGNVYLAGSVRVGLKASGYKDTENIDVFVAKLSANGATLDYLTYLGGSGTDYVNDISVDQNGNAYIVGTTKSSDFPLISPVQSVFGGGSDIFISRLDLAGTLTSSTYLGGVNNDKGYGIAADNAGNVFVTGQSNSMDFPITPGAFQADVNPTGGDVIISKIDMTGSVIKYSTYLGGSLLDVGYDIAIDNDGNAYVTGFTESSNYPLMGSLQSVKGSSSTSSIDAFVTKINTEGSALLYSTFLGGSRVDKGRAIVLDQEGSAYVMGSTFSSDFPVYNAMQSTKSGKLDAFVTKINADGSAYIFSTFLGGDASDQGNDMAIDDLGNIYLTGSTESLNFPVLNAFQASFAGGTRDAFITKMNSDGQSLSYSSYYGGSLIDEGMGVISNAAGEAYVAGRTGSAGFPMVQAINSTYDGGAFNAFIGKIAEKSCSCQGNPSDRCQPEADEKDNLCGTVKK